MVAGWAVVSGRGAQRWCYGCSCSGAALGDDDPALSMSSIAWCWRSLASLASSSDRRRSLTINPAVPVDEVADSYRAARERYAKRRTQGDYRIRTQSLRLLRLAGFVARRRPDMKWGELMQAWNAQCEASERYTQASNFRRDAALAQDRLLYRGLVKPR